jgi:hypothetical protein
MRKNQRVECERWEVGVLEEGTGRIFKYLKDYPVEEG